MTLQHLCFLALFAAVSAGPDPLGAARQATPQPQAQQQKKPPPSAVDLGVDLDRIQRALADTPKLRFDANDKPVFRVQVFGAKPSIDEILGPDWAVGATKYQTMTHQEFLAMVTPTDLQGFGGLTNKEGATIAATSFALQWSLQKAIKKFNETQDAREREAAQKEVLEALNALEEARAKAGLPKK